MEFDINLSCILVTCPSHGHETTCINDLCPGMWKHSFLSRLFRRMSNTYICMIRVTWPLRNPPCWWTGFFFSKLITRRKRSFTADSQKPITGKKKRQINFYSTIDWDHHIWYSMLYVQYQIWWSQSIVDSKVDLKRFFPCVYPINLSFRIYTVMIQTVSILKQKRAVHPDTSCCENLLCRPFSSRDLLRIFP